MTETTNDQGLAVNRFSGPECYARINVTKNTKGHSYETTVSLRWENADDHCRADPNEAFMVTTPSTDQDGSWVARTASSVLQDLNVLADRVARNEIARRQREDEVQS